MTPKLDRPAVLLVTHRGPDNLPARKIVGKVLLAPSGSLIVFHAMSGSQFHGQTRCPAPVDTALTVAMGLSGIPWFLAYDRRRGILWKIAPAAIVHHGETFVYDGRNRFYPAEEFWERLDGVGEEVQSRGARVYTKNGLPILASPYLREEIDLSQ
jgi:hypothetical protein